MGWLSHFANQLHFLAMEKVCSERRPDMLIPFVRDLGRTFPSKTKFKMMAVSFFDPKQPHMQGA